MPRNLRMQSSRRQLISRLAWILVSVGAARVTALAGSTLQVWGCRRTQKTGNGFTAVVVRAAAVGNGAKAGNRLAAIVIGAPAVRNATQRRDWLLNVVVRTATDRRTGPPPVPPLLPARARRLDRRLGGHMAGPGQAKQSNTAANPHGVILSKAGIPSNRIQGGQRSLRVIVLVFTCSSAFEIGSGAWSRAVTGMVRCWRVLANSGWGARAGSGRRISQPPPSAL
jgi:hypothetical protein